MIFLPHTTILSLWTHQGPSVKWLHCPHHMIAHMQTQLTEGRSPRSCKNVALVAAPGPLSLLPRSHYLKCPPLLQVHVSFSSLAQSYLYSRTIFLFNFCSIVGTVLFGDQSYMALLLRYLITLSLEQVWSCSMSESRSPLKSAHNAE